MGVFARSEELFGTSHEQVVFCRDAATGLRAIIAIYSTARGPALGGTRFRPYPTEDAALDDVLRLSRAMAYKAACADLPLGGGKAVIIGDPATDRSDELLRAYGRFVDGLGGRYYTAADVGTTVADMDLISETTSYVTGRSTDRGGAGDSGLLTAFGVFQAMRAAAQVRWGEPSLAGRTVGIEGVGKVGRVLARHLVEDGAIVVVSDVDPARLAQVRAELPTVTALETSALPTSALDVYAPCALGGVLTGAVVDAMKAEIVCGGANNQLATPPIGDRLAARDVLYVPDYVANAGGLIQVADEIHGFDAERARVRAAGVFDTTLEILVSAVAEGVTPATAADRLAERRMRSPADLGAERD
jgi:valine dehydrogenase (NAD+)